MAAVGRVFLDTSVLVAGLIEIGPASGPAQRVLSAAVDGRLSDLHTAWHCCLEFYAVATRLPEEYRLAPGEAVRLLEESVFRHVRVHELPSRLQPTFLQAAVRDRVAGGRIYDAHIAEIARVSSAEWVVTDNIRHFRGLTGATCRVVTAAEFVAQRKA